MDNTCVEFDQNTFNSLLSIAFTMLIQYLLNMTLTFDLKNQ